MKEYKKEDPMPLVSDKTKLSIVLIVMIVFVGRFLYNQFTVEIPRSRISKMLRNTDYIVSEETGEKFVDPVKDSIFFCEIDSNLILLRSTKGNYMFYDANDKELGTYEILGSSKGNGVKSGKIFAIFDDGELK